MTTDPTARPASTPAPVAVPEGDVKRGAAALDDLLTMLGVDPQEYPEHGGETTAETLARAVLRASRLKPVVASLPSEAVLRAATRQASKRAHGHGPYVESVTIAELKDILDRLVPEDDEDTAPVAVPEGVLAEAIEELGRALFPAWEDMLGERSMWRRDIRAGFLAALPIVAPRPEPVVAPLPSERDRLARVICDAHQGDGCKPWDDEHEAWRETYRDMADAVLSAGYRLVSEDDEDTVRVPREAIERLTSHLDACEGGGAWLSSQDVRDLLDGTR